MPHLGWSVAPARDRISTVATIKFDAAVRSSVNNHLSAVREFWEPVASSLRKAIINSAAIGGISRPPQEVFAGIIHLQLKFIRLHKLPAPSLGLTAHTAPRRQ